MIASAPTVTDHCLDESSSGRLPALEEAPRPGAKPKLDAKGHGFLVALACRTPPQGRGDWTLELLSDRLVALGYVDSFSKEAVRRALKKTTSSRGGTSNGPPEHAQPGQPL